MPMGQYSNFADCVSKNKSKDNPSAYCGYIKNQVEGSGKKKEECLMEDGHEAYHLEEEIKLEEEGFVDTAKKIIKAPIQNTADEINYDKKIISGQPVSRKIGPIEAYPFQEEEPIKNPTFPAKERDIDGWEEQKKLEEEISKLEEEERHRVPKGVRHIKERMGADDWTPVPSVENGSKNEKDSYPGSGDKRYERYVCPDDGELLTRDQVDDPNNSHAKHNLPKCIDTREMDSRPKAEAKAFLKTLDATVHDLETLVAKADGKQPSGYGFPTTAVSPTDVLFKVNTRDQKLADVVVKQAENGLEVKVDWYDTVLSELSDIRTSFEKFMIESGFNSKDTVKEYKQAWKENNKTRKD